MYCIYMYENKINQHKYIGMTNNFERRKKDHISASFNSNSSDYFLPIHSAIRKYGKENFNYIILEDNINTEVEAKEKEILWIKKYNTYEDRNHYNLTPGGDLPCHEKVHYGEDSGVSILTLKEVKMCRKFYQEGYRSRDIYDKYFKEKMSYSGFSKVWHGEHWKQVMPEVFKVKPYPGKYSTEQRDIIRELYFKSGLNLYQFSKSPECFVGYGTLWKMVHEPEFYEGK